jgi:hypothetical protein
MSSSNEPSSYPGEIRLGDGTVVPTRVTFHPDVDEGEFRIDDRPDEPPPMIGLCPIHQREFYMVLGGDQDFFPCPQPGCEWDMTVYIAVDVVKEVWDERGGPGRRPRRLFHRGRNH